MQERTARLVGWTVWKRQTRSTEFTRERIPAEAASEGAHDPVDEPLETAGSCFSAEARAKAATLRTTSSGFSLWTTGLSPIRCGGAVFSAEDLQDLRQAAEEFSTTISDSAALVERIKLLQEELAASIDEQTSRTLFVLTVVTVLALPLISATLTGFTLRPGYLALGRGKR
jgi:hypothetical protein